MPRTPLADAAERVFLAKLALELGFDSIEAHHFAIAEVNYHGRSEADLLGAYATAATRPVDVEAFRDLTDNAAAAVLLCAVRADGPIDYVEALLPDRLAHLRLGLGLLRRLA